MPREASRGISYILASYPKKVPTTLNGIGQWRPSLTYITSTSVKPNCIMVGPTLSYTESTVIRIESLYMQLSFRVDAARR